VTVRIAVRVRSDRIPEIRRDLRTNAARVVAKAANDIEGQAKSRAPVDTGFLKSSIQGRMITPTHWRVTVGASYGAYVEFGTRKMAAQPYFLPAIAAVAPVYQAAMRRLLS